MQLNRLLVQVISSLTASLLFYGVLNVSVAEFRLVPYPHSLYAPLANLLLSEEGRPRTVVGGRDRKVCLSACFHDGQVRSPPRDIHCVFVSCTQEMWYRLLSALRWPLSGRSVPFSFLFAGGLEVRDQSPATNVGLQETWHTSSEPCPRSTQFSIERVVHISTARSLKLFAKSQKKRLARIISCSPQWQTLRCRHGKR